MDVRLCDRVVAAEDDRHRGRGHNLPERVLHALEAALGMPPYVRSPA
jgi:hypothetical protein